MKRAFIILVSLIIFLLVKGQRTYVPFYYDSLTINNISTLFQANGTLFDDDSSCVGHPTLSTGFRVPKDSSTYSITAGSLWVGGIDNGGQLHIAAGTYRQNGDDFWPGPIDSSTHSCDSLTSSNWNKIWNVTKVDITNFRANSFPISAGNIPVPILEWPAKGNPYAKGANGVSITVNQTEAPFIDVDGNGLYDPTTGDYPDITGDQMLWWVFNDVLAMHGESGGLPIGVEVQASAYAFYSVSDTILNNTIFVKDKIINMGTSTLDSTYVGSWADIDLGCGIDLAGCDSANSTYYAYHDVPDTFCGAKGYGFSTPFQLVTMLRTPKDSTGNELGMSLFKFYINNFSVIGNPTSANEYFKYMKGQWLDGSPQTTAVYCSNYGGTWTTNYLFNGSPSDTMPGLDTKSECHCNPFAAADIKELASSGPFTFAPGDIQTLEQAYIFTIQPGFQSCPSYPDSVVQHVRSFYNSSVLATIPFVSGGSFELNLYPNPSDGMINYNLTVLTDKATYALDDITGRTLLKGEAVENGRLNLTTLAKGIYFFRINSSLGSLTKKIILQ